MGDERRSLARGGSRAANAIPGNRPVSHQSNAGDKGLSRELNTGSGSWCKQIRAGFVERPIKFDCAMSAIAAAEYCNQSILQSSPITRGGLFHLRRENFLADFADFRGK